MNWDEKEVKVWVHVCVREASQFLSEMQALGRKVATEPVANPNSGGYADVAYHDPSWNHDRKRSRKTEDRRRN